MNKICIIPVAGQDKIMNKIIKLKTAELNWIVVIAIFKKVKKLNNSYF